MQKELLSIPGPGKKNDSSPVILEKKKRKERQCQILLTFRLKYAKMKFDENEHNRLWSLPANTSAYT